MTSGRTPRRPRQRRQPLFWTHRAIADLDAIGDYIARDAPAAAERWLTRLIGAAERAARVPLAGRRVPELPRDDIREVLLRSYRIVYRVDGDGVTILTVFEGHRTFPHPAD